MLETQADPDHIQHIETKPHFMSNEKLPDIPQKWSDRMQTFQIPGISIAVADQGRLDWCKGQDELAMTNSYPGCEQTKALASELIRSVEQEYHWANHIHQLEYPATNPQRGYYNRDFPLYPGSGAIPRIQTDLFIWHSDNRGTYLTHLFDHATVTPICFPCARRSHHGGVP